MSQKPPAENDMGVIAVVIEAVQKGQSLFFVLSGAVEGLIHPVLYFCVVFTFISTETVIHKKR
jgi:hypothetical protein